MLKIFYFIVYTFLVPKVILINFNLIYISNQPNYMQPLVVVKLNVTLNKDVTILCTSYFSNSSKNIEFTIKINN